MADKQTVRATGWKSIHPLMQAALSNIGVKGTSITQGWGTNVAASAGFHDPEGEIDGHPYSSCVDLSWSIASVELKSLLVEAGFAPFFRYPASGWTGSKHIHSVFIGITDASGSPTILAGPRQQINDAYRGLNGLAGHSTYRGNYTFTDDERTRIRSLYSDWVVDEATRIISPEGNEILSYAFFEGDAVRCEVRPFYTYWGVHIVGWQDGNLICEHDGKTLDLTAAKPAIVGGQFTRANVRQLAEAIGLKVKFAWAADKRTAAVNLSY